MRICNPDGNLVFWVFFHCRSQHCHTFFPSVHKLPQTFIVTFNYCEPLRQVKKDIKNKRRCHRSGVILHHDNAKPHTAAQMVQTINALGWELLPHPPSSPDLAPSDFHLFAPLKAFKGGMKFESDDEVKSVVSDWLRHQSKDFDTEGIWKLVHRWETCVTVLGDYVDFFFF
uniref:Histone-lysine N-methyltransferase SETMAR n=1 Tax=Hippocampus comes TaxID=109280 RepID=A0A3Q2XZ31_HIPCM